MSRYTRLSKINQIRELINKPPEPSATFWLYENGIYHKYNEQSGTWEPSTPETMNRESNSRSWLFLSGDDSEPVFKGQCMAIAGPIETRGYLTGCKCTPDEIETRLKNHCTARELADEVIKAIFINT